MVYNWLAYVMILHGRSLDDNSSDRSWSQENSGLDECSLADKRKRCQPSAGNSLILFPGYVTVINDN